jgi:hypothetical protein
MVLLENEVKDEVRRMGEASAVVVCLRVCGVFGVRQAKSRVVVLVGKTKKGQETKPQGERTDEWKLPNARP